jgi:diguanylate cyclase (GGDEF)-like protein
MTSQIISRAELDKYLSIYSLHQPQHSEDQAPYTQLLEWMKRQSPETLLKRECQPGEIILPEGEQSDMFYVIRSGQTVVIKGDLESPTVIGFRSVGDAIGEMGLLENLPRSATVIALGPVSLCGLRRETFHLFLAENPAFGLSLMSMLSGRIRESDEERRRGYVRERQKEDVLEDLSKLATFDALTGLFNRRIMDEILRDETIRAIQNDQSVGIIMADIDHFKQINDTYGHLAGDLMLQTAANTLKKCVRSADSVCRYGGEEFVIIMPGASFEILARCAENIRVSFAALRAEYQDLSMSATISLGLASFPQHGKNGGEVLERADQALYQAKRSGRNRVVLYASET